MERQTIQALPPEHRHWIGMRIIKTVVALPNGQRLRLNQHPHSELPAIGSAVTVYWDMDKAVIMHTAEDTLYDLIEDALLNRPDLAVKQGRRAEGGKSF